MQANVVTHTGSRNTAYFRAVETGEVVEFDLSDEAYAALAEKGAGAPQVDLPRGKTWEWTHAIGGVPILDGDRARLFDPGDVVVMADGSARYNDGESIRKLEPGRYTLRAAGELKIE